MPSKLLTKEDIQRAMKVTRSNRAAARYLHVTYNTYKKYASLYKNEDDITLLEAHKNQEGKGIPKYANRKISEVPLEDIVEGRVPTEYLDVKEVKRRLIFEAYLEEKCSHCGFSERRVHDTKVPVILNHKDGNKKNYHLDNLEFLCYNCSFLYATSAISEEQVEAQEDFVERRDTHDWQMDEHHIEHLKNLNLFNDEEESPGDEYISRQ
tara:strand:+ start:5570 stop:6196 length:627 start_codon:yes stop_codon:yes gene_type:complete